MKNAQPALVFTLLLVMFVLIRFYSSNEVAQPVGVQGESQPQSQEQGSEQAEPEQESAVQEDSPDSTTDKWEQSPNGESDQLQQVISTDLPPQPPSDPGLPAGTTQVVYNDELITAMYAIDTELGLSATVNVSQNLIEEIEEYAGEHPNVSSEYARFGYIIYTGNKSETVYFAPDAPADYVVRCKDNFQYDHRMRIHSLTQMDMYEIERIEYSGMDALLEKTVEVDTTSPEEIMAVATALKDIVPYTDATKMGNRINVEPKAEGYTLTITFSDGGKYHIHGYSGGSGLPYEGSIFVHLSGTGYTMGYNDVQQNDIEVLRSAAQGLPSAIVTQVVL